MQTAHALFVGHDDQAGQTVRDVFDRRGIALRQRSGTLEAMRHIEDNPVTAIIVDFDMPDGGALALKEHVETVSEECPVVLIVPSDVEPEWLLLFDCYELERPVSEAAVEELLGELGFGLANEKTQKDSPVLAPQRGTSTAAYVIPYAGGHDLSGAVEAPVSAAAGSEEGPEFERRTSLPSFLKSRPSMFYRAIPAEKHKDAVPSGQPSVSASKTPAPKSELVGLNGERTNKAEAQQRRRPKKDIRRTTATTADHAVYARVDTNVRTNFDLKGKLELIPLPTVFWKLFANRMSGVLKLDERSIYVKGGVPVFIESNVLSESFAQYLSRRGWLKAADVERIHQGLKPGESLPEALASQLVLSEELVAHAVRDWIHSTLLHCFRSKTGSYRFERGRDWIGSVPEEAFNPIQLIAEALYQTLDPNLLAAELELLLDRFPVKTEKYFEFLRFFPANRQEWEWIEAIDGTRTVSQLTLVAKGNIVGLLTLVYSLKAADIIDFSDSPRQLPRRSRDRSDPEIREGYLTRANPVVGGHDAGHSQAQPPCPDASAAVEQEAASPDATTPQDLEAEAAPEESVDGGRVADTDRNAELDEQPQSAPVATRAGGVSDMEAALADYLERSSYDDPYYLLDVPRTATTAEVAIGYQKFLARLPQTGLDELSPAAKDNAFRLHEEVQRAFNTITVELLRGEFSIHRSKADHRMGEDHRKAQIESLRRSSMVGKERAMKVDLRRGSAPPELRPEGGHQSQKGYAEAYYNEAKRLVNQNRWSDALSVINEAVELLPHSAPIVTLEAWISFHQATAKPETKLDYCADRLLNAIALSPKNADAHFYLGIVRKAQKKLPEALAAFEEAKRINPDSTHRSLNQEIKSLRQRGVRPRVQSKNMGNRSV